MLLQLKNLTQTTYYLPCLVPYLVQLVDELGTKLYAIASFMLTILNKVLELCKFLSFV